MELDGIKESRGIAGRIRGFNVRNLRINWNYAVIPNHVDHNPEWRTPRTTTTEPDGHGSETELVNATATDREVLRDVAGEGIDFSVRMKHTQTL